MALLLVTVLFAAGALYVKYKLEGLRSVVQREVEARTGARVRVGNVVVNGLRGFRLDDLDLALVLADGPVLRCAADVAYVYIDVADLLNGRVTVNRVETDGATIRVDRASDRPWIAPDRAGITEAAHFLDSPAFRFVGKNCTLEVDKVVGESRLIITELGFDVARMTGSLDILAKVSGKLARAAGKDIKVDLRFTSLEDFDLRVHCDALSAQDVAVFLPASERLVRNGTAAPSLRVAGYPGMTLVLAFEVPFRDLTVRSQPDFIHPISGTLTGVASYDATKHVLSLTTAKAESDQLAGRVEGSISFDGPLPALDLRLDATRLPVTEALSYALEGQADAYGGYDLKLEEPCQVYVTLQGTTDAPVIAFHGSAGAGEFSFAPSDPSSPEASLQLGPITLAWSSETPTPAGSFTVVDGTFTHETTGLKAEKVSGVLTVGNKRIVMDPFNATVTGNPFVGGLKYDVEEDHLELSVNGAISGLENTLLAKAFPDVSLAGAVSVRGSVVKTANRYAIDAWLDATQAEIGYQWWFLKPAGIGGEARKLHVDLAPNQSLTFSIESTIASSRFHTAAVLDHKKSTWQLASAQITSDKLDVDAIGKCLHLAYKVSGGTGVEAQWEWKRDAVDGRQWSMTASGSIDKLALLPEGGETPLACEGLHAAVSVTGAADPKGVVTLTARKARLPAIKGKWFVPLRPEGVPGAPDTRSWTYDLAAEALDAPPWKGTHFAAQAYTTPQESGFRSFDAKVGDGHVAGSYRNIKQDNAYDLAFTWSGVPAAYLIDQLDYPRVLTGLSSGTVGYFLDRDDPNTLKGQGRFEVHDGQFSADFLVSQLQGRLEDQISALPPSLKFSLLKSDVAFEKDQVKTSNVQLDSKGIKISGDGTFVVHGDMDYDVKVAVSPQVADTIPALRDNFNIQGLRLAQQDIELVFKVTGPTFNPKGELAEMPPLGVTLVSSAFEVTSDAMRVIDIPRKVLADLLKIGGGIVGISK